MSSVVVSVSLHRLLALQSDQAFNVVRVLKCSFGNSAGCLSAFVGFKCYLAQLSLAGLPPMVPHTLLRRVQ